MAPPPGKGLHTAIIVVIVVLGFFVVLGILGALAIPLYMKYVQKAKTSEAQVNLGKIATLVEVYYAGRAEMGGGSSVQYGALEALPGGYPTNARVSSPCAAPDCNGECVPRRIADVANRKYQPSEGEWLESDSGEPTAWAMMHFVITQPIRFQYCYAGWGEGDSSRFEAVAFGDLDGDGTWSEFRRVGQVVAGRPAIGPLSVRNEGE